MCRFRQTPGRSSSIALLMYVRRRDRESTAAACVMCLWLSCWPHNLSPPSISLADPTHKAPVNLGQID
jgi:hypothetical protein